VYARAELGIVDGDDPVTVIGAVRLADAVATFMCGPQNSSYVYSCETSTPCVELCTTQSGSSVGTTNVNFSRCVWTSDCAPTLFVATSGPDQYGIIGSSSVSAYAPPLSPSSVSACSFNSSLQMSDLLYLCRRAFGDDANKRVITTFSTWDRRSASYSFSYAIIGRISGSTLYASFAYPFNTTYTKGSTDIYRYLYDIAVSYQ